MLAGLVADFRYAVTLWRIDSGGQLAIAGSRHASR